MIPLIVFYTAGLSFCEDSIDQKACARAFANDAVLEQIVNPGHDKDWYLEFAAERLDSAWWPEGE